MQWEIVPAPRVTPLNQNSSRHMVSSAGHVEVPPMVQIMITGPDPGAVRPGHSHGAKCAVKCHYKTSCCKCTTCGAWDHRDKSSRICFQAGTRKTSPKDRGPVEATKAQDDNNASCVFDQLCTASGHSRSLDCASPQGTTAMASKCRNSTREATRLEHHVFDGKWVARPSKSYPMLLVTMLLVTITPSPQDHVSFGVPMRETSKLASVTMSMVADTGCQSTIIHLKSTYAMGIETGPHPCEARYAWCYERGPRSDGGSQSA